MFNRDQAESLRKRLSPLDFSTPFVAEDLVLDYRKFYGLNHVIEETRSECRMGTVDVAGYQVVVQHFAPERNPSPGTIFLLHGYFDHAGLFRHLIRFCLESGYSVIIPDLPGHGLSSGKPASIRHFEHYAHSLFACLDAASAAKLVKPWHVIGQSTGAAVIIDSLLNYGLATNYAIGNKILLAPLLRPRKWAITGLLFPLVSLFTEKLKRGFAPNSHDQEFLAFIRHTDPLQSKVLPLDWVAAMSDYINRFRQAASSDEALHIVQGTDDTTVDWHYNTRQILARFPASSLHLVEGARHHMVNESPAYRDRIFAEVNRLLSG